MRISTAARDAAADAVVDRLDRGGAAAAGAFQLYEGTRPDSLDLPPTGSTLLVTVPCFDPAFGDAEAGQAPLNGPIAAVCVATGTAEWGRAVDRDGVAVFDVTVGNADAELILDIVNLINGGTATIATFTYTQPEGA